MTGWLEDEDEFEEPVSIFAGCDEEDGGCGWLWDEEDDRQACERVIRMGDDRDLGGCE